MQEAQFPSSIEFQYVNIFGRMVCGNRLHGENSSKLKYVVDNVTVILYSLMHVECCYFGFCLYKQL